METNEDDYDSESDRSVSNGADETEIHLVTESQEEGNQVKIICSSELGSYKVLTVEDVVVLMKRSIEEVRRYYVFFL